MRPLQLCLTMVQVSRHQTLFTDALGILKYFARDTAASDATPFFYKPRAVPFAMKKKVEPETEMLLEERIIEAVKFSERATPSRGVPILRPVCRAVMCGDTQ